MKTLRLVMLLALTLTACSTGSLTRSGQDGTTTPANAIELSFVFSPEKETWLTERFKAFEATNPKLNGRPIVVKGTQMSSGAARTEIRQGSIKPVIWSPSASAWLEVL